MLTRLSVVAAAALAAAPVEAQIGLTSGAGALTLSATKLASISVSLPRGSSATSSGSRGAGPNDGTPISVVTTWDVDPGSAGSVKLVAFFDRPALAEPPAAISIAGVDGPSPAGGPKSAAPFPGTPIDAEASVVGTAGMTLVVFTQTISVARVSGARSDDLRKRLDLRDGPGLSAGSSARTLNLLVLMQ
jgi:hypothetical protein